MPPLLDILQLSGPMTKYRLPPKPEDCVERTHLMAIPSRDLPTLWNRFSPYLICAVGQSTHKHPLTRERPERRGRFPGKTLRYQASTPTRLVGEEREKDQSLDHRIGPHLPDLRTSKSLRAGKSGSRLGPLTAKQTRFIRLQASESYHRHRSTAHRIPNGVAFYPRPRVSPGDITNIVARVASSETFCFLSLPVSSPPHHLPKISKHLLKTGLAADKSYSPEPSPQHLPYFFSLRSNG